MELRAGSIEEAPDPVPEPLRGEVHPQPPVWIPDVLEDVDPVGPEFPSDVREGLRQRRRRRRYAPHDEIGRRVGGRGRALGCAHTPRYRRPSGAAEGVSLLPFPADGRLQADPPRTPVRAGARHRQAAEDGGGSAEAPGRERMAGDGAEAAARPHLGAVRAVGPRAHAGAATEEGARDPDRAPAASRQPGRPVQRRPALADIPRYAGYRPVEESLLRTSFGYNREHAHPVRTPLLSMRVRTG